VAGQDLTTTKTSLTTDVAGSRTNNGLNKRWVYHSYAELLLALEKHYKNV
jgi:hypothetical protein